MIFSLRRVGRCDASERLFKTLCERWSTLGQTSDTLDWSSTERGRLVLEAIPVAMGPLVRDVTEDFRLEIARKGLTLHTAFGDATIAGDQALLTQVIYNLLSNALRFTDARQISVTLTADDATLRLSVGDTGIGIAPEEHQRIFETLHQVDNSDTRRYPGLGLGLGLSIVAEIMRQPGGQISVDSALGQGTTVTLILPVCCTNAVAR